MKNLISSVIVLLLAGCATTKEPDYSSHQLIGDWHGTWDGVWKTEFNITHVDGNEFKVDYFWEEIPGQQMRQSTLSAYATDEFSIQTDGPIRIYTSEEGSFEVIAIGNFSTPRRTTLSPAKQVSGQSPTESADSAERLENAIALTELQGARTFEIHSFLSGLEKEKTTKTLVTPYSS